MGKSFLAYALAICLMACTSRPAESERLAKGLPGSEQLARGLEAAFDISTMAPNHYRDSPGPDPTVVLALGRAEARARQSVEKASSDIRSATTARERDAALGHGIDAIQRYEAETREYGVLGAPVLHGALGSQLVSRP